MNLTNNGKKILNGFITSGRFGAADTYYPAIKLRNTIKTIDGTEYNSGTCLIGYDYFSSTSIRCVYNISKYGLFPDRFAHYYNPHTSVAYNNDNVLMVEFTNENTPLTENSYDASIRAALAVSDAKDNKGNIIYTLTNNTDNNVSVNNIAIYSQIAYTSTDISVAKTQSNKYVLVAYHSFETKTLEPNQVLVVKIGYDRSITLE